MANEDLEGVIRSVCPALRAASPDERERAQFLYDLVREVYDYVKFDVHGPDVDADERSRVGEVVSAALPPV